MNKHREKEMGVSRFVCYMMTHRRLTLWCMTTWNGTMTVPGSCVLASRICHCTTTIDNATFRDGCAHVLFKTAMTNTGIILPWRDVSRQDAMKWQPEDAMAYGKDADRVRKRRNTHGSKQIALLVVPVDAN